MNTKKIWMLAIVFGAIMSTFFYIMTSKGNTDKVAVATEAVTEQEIKDSSQEPNTDFTIQAGKRAISIAVDEIQSVSGFIRPGSKVDVIAVLPPAAGEETTSKIILTDVNVLAVGKTVAKDTTNGKTTENSEPYQMITLEVEPSEGATLAFAKEFGVVTLMLRGIEPGESTGNVNISLEQLKKD